MKDGQVEAQHGERNIVELSIDLFIGSIGYIIHTGAQPFTCH